MQNDHRIQIPVPCNEDWASMPEAEQGKHCAKCAKVVRNFVGIDHAAILSEMQAASEPICARIDASVIQSPRLHGHRAMWFSPVRLKQFAIAFVLAFGFEVWGLSQVQAQKLQPLLEAMRDTAKLDAAINDHLRESNVLRGKVVDVYTREPVQFARVRVYIEDKMLAETMSDEAGRFELSFPKNARNSEGYELRLLYLGQERRDHIVGVDVAEFSYLIDASQMIEGIEINERIYPWSVDPIFSISKGTLVGMLAMTMEDRSFYRPLEEWLIMNFSEIHPSGRW
jgi:hypothetical protein